MAEIEFGQPEKSEAYLGQASEALKRAIFYDRLIMPLSGS